MHDADPAALCRRYAARWGLRDIKALGATRDAYLWRATDSDGVDVALKIIVKDEGLPMARGANAYLVAQQGHGGVPVRHCDDIASLTQWLPDGPLIDLFDAGQITDAFEIQFQLTLRLLASPAPVARMTPLSTILAPALAMAGANVPTPARDVVATAQRFVRAAQKADRPDVALHGDIHPRNIIRDGETWHAIDPRGLRGPRAFEFAPSFINPWRFHNDIFGATGMMDHARRIARHLHCGTAEVLVWAMANALFQCELQFRTGDGAQPVACLSKLLHHLAETAQQKRHP